MFAVAAAQFSIKRMPFFMYTLMMFFIILGDAIMSYVTPVILDRTLGSATAMGLVAPAPLS